jgi:16S rRNA (cytosine967-C5)-methyltransferase
MRDGGRLQAAIEVLADIEARHRTAADAVKDWGLSHRFAGSGDRAAISSLVLDALRRRASFGARLGGETPRALVIATYALAWGRGTTGLDAALADPHAPEPLTEAERAALAAEPAADAPAHVAGDFPEWLTPSFERAFGERAAEEGAALAARAPVDLRVNTLKATRKTALAELAEIGAEPCALSPLGIRVALPEGPARGPNIENEPAYLKGLVEIQDEGSQLAALVAAARSGEQVLDLCAGAGGKTLALAAMMENRGQVFAYDADKRRFGDILERIRRAGARNIQIRYPGRGDVLADLAGHMDLVLVDAPCTGTGTWRRRPDAKWRLRPNALDLRAGEQDAVLDEAARHVKPGGRLVYVTCSVLPEENEDRLDAFLRRNGAFEMADPLADLGAVDAATATRLAPFVKRGERVEPVLRLSPASAGTDGFFVGVMRRS